MALAGVWGAAGVWGEDSLSFFLPLVPSVSQVFTLEVRKALELEVSTILSTANVGILEILKDKLIELNTFNNTSTLYNQEVIGGYRPIADIKVYTAEGYGLHIRSAEEMNELIQALVKRIDILERI